LAAPPVEGNPLRGDIDAWLTLTADLVITIALLQSSVSRALGQSLPWISVLLPAIFANCASALYARRHGLTALAFGPNTVFIVVFGRAILGPQNLEWSAAGWTDAARIEASLALLGASLLIYAGVVALGVLAMVRWRPVLPRKALVIPLAAICWTHLVGTSVQSLASESLAVWLPAALLFGLLFFTTKGPLTWLFAVGLWAVLSSASKTSRSWHRATFGARSSRSSPHWPSPTALAFWRTSPPRGRWAIDTRRKRRWPRSPQER
jgi:hypothetical protein